MSVTDMTLMTEAGPLIVRPSPPIFRSMSVPDGSALSLDDTPLETVAEENPAGTGGFTIWLLRDYTNPGWYAQRCFVIHNVTITRPLPKAAFNVQLTPGVLRKGSELLTNKTEMRIGLDAEDPYHRAVIERIELWEQARADDFFSNISAYLEPRAAQKAKREHVTIKNGLVTPAKTDENNGGIAKKSPDTHSIYATVKHWNNAFEECTVDAPRNVAGKPYIANAKWTKRTFQDTAFGNAWSPTAFMMTTTPAKDIDPANPWATYSPYTIDTSSGAPVTEESDPSDALLDPEDGGLVLRMAGPQDVNRCKATVVLSLPGFHLFDRKEPRITTKDVEVVGVFYRYMPAPPRERSNDAPVIKDDRYEKARDEALRRLPVITREALATRIDLALGAPRADLLDYTVDHPAAEPARPAADSARPDAEHPEPPQMGAEDPDLAGQKRRRDAPPEETSASVARPEPESPPSNTRVRRTLQL